MKLFGYVQTLVTIYSLNELEVTSCYSLM